jgi:hypothetical protein
VSQISPIAIEIAENGHSLVELGNRSVQVLTPGGTVVKTPPGAELANPDWQRS